MSRYSYYGYAPYVPVAERRKKAEKAAAAASKKDKVFSPIPAYRGAIAKSFWGNAWCTNLEAYGDYANRLPRGRTYVRNGSVIDLQISPGQVQARVVGSSLYQVEVTVKPVPTPVWQAIGQDCAGSIDTLVELLRGQLSSAVMQRICQPRTGLFPSPAEIDFDCSCPDFAYMCKHVAAVLYGVGARLDSQPDLLFTLRKVNAQDLVALAGAGVVAQAGKTAIAKTGKGKVLDDARLGDVFGIEMDGVEAVDALDTVQAAAPVVKKAVVVKKAAAPKKSTAAKKAIGIKKPAAKKIEAKKSAKLAKKKLAKAPAVKKPTVKKAAAKMVSIKKVVAKKAGAKKSHAKQVVASKKATAKRAGVNKPTVN